MTKDTMTTGKSKKKFYTIQPEIHVGNEILTSLTIQRYENGRIAIALDTKDYEYWGRISVNLPDHILPDKNWFFAQNYSIMKLTYEACLKAGIIEVVPGICGEAGYWGEIPVCRLTMKGIE